jgi:hypothetical protein
MAEDWELHNLHQAASRNRREVVPYTYMTSQLIYRSVYAETSAVLTTLRDKGPLGAGFASREQLEAKCSQFQSEAEQLRVERDDGISREKTLNEGMTVLKSEHRALFDENDRLQQIKEKAVTESEYFSTELIKAKHNNAELMQRVFEAEQALLAIKRGESLPTPMEASSPRDSKICISFDAPSSPTNGSGFGACFAPSSTQFEVESVHEGDVQGLTFTENGKQIWTGGADKYIKCWDATTGKLVTRIPSVAAALSLHSCGDMLVAGCSDSTIRVWEISKLRGKCQLTGHGEKVVSVSLSSDARHVFSTSTDRTVKRWDVAREQLTNTIMCLSGCNDVVSVNDKVATGHHDGVVRLYDSRDCKEAGKVRMHDKPITALRFSQDGQVLATLSKDNTIKVCDVRTLNPLYELTHPNLSVGSNMQRLALSPDGKYCSTGSSSGSVYVWECNAAGRVVSTLNSHAGHVSNIAWSPQGRGLAAIGTDKKLIMFR